MDIGFIDPRVNLSNMILIYGNTESQYQSYKAIIRSCADYTFILSNQHCNINEETISFTLNKVTNDKFYSYNYVVISDDNVFYICKITSYTRTDITTYRFRCIIDKVLSNPRYHYCNIGTNVYGGDTHNANYSVPLDKIIFSKNYMELTNSNTKDYILCAVIAKDPALVGWEYNGPNNKITDTSFSNKDSIINKVNMGYTSLVVFYKQSPSTNANVSSEGNVYNILEDANYEGFANTTLSDSILSFKQWYNYIESLGSVNSTPLQNILSVYIIPKIIVKTDNIYMQYSKSGQVGNNIYRNVVCNCGDKIEVVGGTPQYYPSVNGYYHTLKSIIIDDFSNHYTDLEDMCNKLSNIYYKKSPIRGLINVRIGTSNGEIELPIDQISQYKNIFIIPYCNGSNIEYIIDLGISAPSNRFRLHGEFTAIPILSNGYERFYNFENNILKMQQIQAGVQYGFQLNELAMHYGYMRGKTPKNPMLSKDTNTGSFLRAASELNNTIMQRDFREYELKNASMEIESYGNSAKMFVYGLFKILVTAPNAHNIEIFNNDINYYGVKSDIIESISFDTLQNTTVKYCLMKDGVFSSTDIQNKLSNGCFIVSIDNTFTSPYQRLIEINKKGISG